jgi:AraC-like DNA-binding protein
LKEIFEPIRSLYHFETPCEELQPYVEFFSESAPDRYYLFTGGNSFRIEMYPSWTPTMYINLGPSYRMTVGTKTLEVKAGADVLLLRDGYVCRHNQPDDHIFSVKFFPGGLEAVVGLSQLSLAGKVIPLHKVLPAELLIQIKSAASFRERIVILERFFLEAKRRYSGDHYLTFVTDTLASYSDGVMQFNVDQVAEQRFVSSKTLNRYFHRVVGLSPKKYLSLVRARTALTSFLADRSSFDPEEYGYYDRSHFYRDMISFTGQRIKEI